MDITCEQCQGRFKIPDEKVPKDRSFSVTCPKCRNKIPVDARTATPEPADKETPPSAPPSEPGPAAEKSLLDEVAAGGYDASEKPFDFVEEGVETALLCESDAGVKSKLHGVLDALGYQATEPATAVDALKQMRFHIFDLIILNEMFDTDNPDECDVLESLQQLSMETRRQIFVALITDRFRTMDDMAAFNRSVNLIVNPKNIDEIEKILQRAVADNAAFYRVYSEALVSTGRV